MGAGQIIWVDCADEENLSASDKNNIVLDIPEHNNQSPGATPSTTPNPTGMNQGMCKDFFTECHLVMSL